MSRAAPSSGREGGSDRRRGGVRFGRRDLLRASVVGSAAAAVGIGGETAEAAPAPRKPQGTPTICPYCAVGCGMLVRAEEGRVVRIEGDPDHPINRGALCSKGAGLPGTVNSPRRATKPLHRAPGASEWREVGWDFALDRVARRIKETRDARWTERDAKGRLVRRTEALAVLGGAALDNEECSLLAKAARGLGVVFLEHQART